MKATFSKDMALPLRLGRKGYLAELRYTTDDPHAVTLAVPDDDYGWVLWEFHRDLLRDGLTRPAGHGDVSVWPGAHPTRMRIRLTSKTGDVTFECAKALVAQFVARIYEAVPTDEEHQWMDMDAEILELLEQA